MLSTRSKQAASLLDAQSSGLVAESWMATNAQLLRGLRSQSASSAMIQLFVILAVALGIAIGVGTVSALLPARRAARMNPADAIRTG